MAEKQNTPEIRFKGFTDPWEQRKLGEVADRYDNLRIPITASERVPGSTPYYGANGIQDYVEGFTHQGEFVLIAEDGASDLDNYPTMCINGIIWVNNHAHVIQGRKDITDNHFIAWSIKRCDIKPMLTGGTRAKLNAEVLMGMRISTPNHAEQISIGSFFEHLDSLITLHQRKHDKLCTVKRSMLDKMFPKPGETEPEIRFKGFTDPWEQRKLNQFIYVTSEKNVDGAFVRGDVLSVSREEGVVNQIEFQGRSFAGADVSVYGILRHGDIVYTKSPLRANPYGIIKTNKGRSGIVSTLYATYRARPGVDSDFIQCYFDQDARLNNYLHPLVNKGAKNDMKVSAENAITGNVCFPGCEEQRLISSLFDRLDNLITLHQRKLDLLKNTKKSLLDKMFV